MSAPQPFRPCTYLEHHATTRPGTPAILEQGETIDFGQLYRRVRALMTYLRASGVGPGQVVAVCLPNVWEYVALEIAIPAIGAVVMPLAPSLGAYEVGSALERSGATVLVGALPGESPGVDAGPGESTGTVPAGRDRGVVTPGESPGAVPAAGSSPLARTAD
ncbi:MAG TPA: AMP-binding protein, partial [Acidimicrobiales bacterium]|nr:AMP-binding protein [Acidimicrobiales bacterium]